MTLEERVARLERKSRLYRNLFLLVALLLVALVSWGQTQAVPDAIEARSFVVLDRETGAPVAMLGQKATGGSLDIMDRDSARVGYLDVTGAGKGRLMLCTPGGAMRRDCEELVSP